ncbi:MAG: dUTP diphosphatase [Gemmatimonadota bacterium]|nr:dUTP diphosphatase [Gemmatimonadota bacterium]
MRDRVRFTRVGDQADLLPPARGSARAAGYDVRAAESVTLEPGEIRLVGTGFALELPEHLECQVRPRSGLALKHGITVPNSPGTIDPDYRGELRIILQNSGCETVRLDRGERIAQLVFARFETPELSEVSVLSSTDRGDGGFGSTGTS